MKKAKVITIKCDLGGWRLTKCRGTYAKGFKPIEPIEKVIPLWAALHRNNAYWVRISKQIGYTIDMRYHWPDYHFPYPLIEKKFRNGTYRQTKSKRSK